MSSRLLLTMGALLFLPGCVVEVTTRTPVSERVASTTIEERVADALPSYASRREHTVPETGSRVSFLAVRLDSDTWTWRMEDDPASPKTVSAWRAALGADIIVNGSYFDDAGRASGYYDRGTGTSAVPWPGERARQDRAGYTGAVLLKGGALTLAYLPEDRVDPAEPDAAFLTFPTLIAGGAAAVEKESGLSARRTALAEAADGTDYLVVTETGSLTLRQFSRWLAEQPERFTRAVNLDGGPSTGISLRDGDTALDVASAPVPNVLAAVRR